MRTRSFTAGAVVAGCVLAITAWLAGRVGAGEIDILDARPLARMTTNSLTERQRVWDAQHLLAALQGLANREQPRLYVYFVGSGGRIDRFWLEKIRARDGWMPDAPLREQTNLLELVSKYRSVYRGTVVWDERVPATALIASTAAGVDDLLPLRYDPQPGTLYYQLVVSPTGPQLPVRLRLLKTDGEPMFDGRRTGSAKCDAALWAADEFIFKRRSNPAFMAYYPDGWWLRGKTTVPAERTLLCNHDYFIARRAFFFDLGPWDDEAPNDDPQQREGLDARTLRQVFEAAYKAAEGRPIHVGGFTPWDQKYTDFTGGKHEGVPTEWRYAEILSCYNAFMDADAPGLHAMANASFFQHQPLKDRYPQPPMPDKAALQKAGYLDAGGAVIPKSYAAIYAGDYDSAAWLYQKLPEIWDHRSRGTVPLGWAFNPALAARFPLGLLYTRATASPNDCFISGDSGYGYLNPGYLVPPRKWSGLPSGLQTWERLCAEGYRRWDLSITGFVIDGNAPPMSPEVQAAYARFSPGGVVAQKIPRQSLVSGVPFLRMGSDLPDPKQGANSVSAAFKKSESAPQFGIFRTILWTPGQHQEMFQRVQKDRPDIVFVTPHTLFALLRIHLNAAGK